MTPPSRAGHTDPLPEGSVDTAAPRPRSHSTGSAPLTAGAERWDKESAPPAAFLPSCPPPRAPREYPNSSRRIPAV